MTQPKDELAAVLQGLGRRSEESARAAAAGLLEDPGVAEAVEAARGGRYKLFRYRVILPLHRAARGAAAAVTVSPEARFLLEQRDFVENQFLAVIQRVEGSACCADKARTIVRALLAHFTRARPIAWDYDQEHTFHLPQEVFVTEASVLAFFTAVHQLYHGDPDAFAETYQRLVAHEAGGGSA